MTPDELWQEFCRETGTDPAEKYTAWAFCGGGPEADTLLQLVLEGKKFGTASIAEEYQAEGETIPGNREYSVVLNSRGEAACVIRNFDVRNEPFDRVSEYHGFSEGEEERNLDAWRRIHAAYWQPDLEKMGIADAHHCHAVLEKFTLEYIAEEYREGAVTPEECFLIEPTMRYADEIIAYRRDMIAADSSMDGTLSLKRMADPAEFTQYAYDWGNPSRELGENGIRGTLLMCIRKSDDKLIGMTQIRVIPETHEKVIVGHIGYSVRPDERCKGYAKWILKKSLEFLRYGRGIERAEISVLPHNEASIRTILANGGYYRDTVDIEDDGGKLDRYWIDLKDHF